MEIIRFDTIDSTFVEAARQASNLESGAYLFTAREQTAGRGQGTHSFYSPKDNGIYATLLLTGEFADVCEPAFSSKINPLASVVITEAVLRSCSDFKDRVGIKWANDLLLDGKKYGGILSAVTVKEGKLVSIRIGFGINTGYADMPELLHRRVTTLGLDATDTESLLIDIAQSLIERLGTADQDALYNEYMEYCTTPGRSLMLPDGRCGTALGVASDFSLIFSVDGKRPEFTSSTAGIIIL